MSAGKVLNVMERAKLTLFIHLVSCECFVCKCRDWECIQLSPTDFDVTLDGKYTFHPDAVEREKKAQRWNKLEQLPLKERP